MNEYTNKKMNSAACTLKPLRQSFVSKKDEKLKFIYSKIE